MASLQAFMHKLGKAAGLSPETNEAFKTILANEALASIEVDTTMENVIMTNLMNVESAKNNPTLAAHFKATALNGIDRLLEDTSSEFELSDEQINAIKTADKTQTRILALKQALKDTYEKKGAKNKDKEAIEAERLQLNNKIAELTQKVADTETNLRNQFNQELHDRDYRSMLSGYDYATNEVLDRDSAQMIADNKVKKYLSEKGWNVKYDPKSEEKFKVVLSDGLDAYEQNQPVKFKALVDKVVADNKLIRVSNANQQQNQNQQQRQSTTVTDKPTSQAMNKATSEMEAQLERVIATSNNL